MKKIFTVVLIFALFTTAGCDLSTRPLVSSSESSLSSRELEKSAKEESKLQASKEAERIKEMINVSSATCKRNESGIPEITVTYHFLNNTGEVTSFSKMFIDTVKYEHEIIPSLKADEKAMEKELQPGESIDVNIVYEGFGTISGFLEVMLMDITGKKGLYWHCFELK